jgi:hypothetical protein
MQNVERCTLVRIASFVLSISVEKLVNEGQMHREGSEVTAKKQK